MNKEKLKNIQEQLTTSCHHGEPTLPNAIIDILKALLEEDKEEVKVKDQPQHKPTEDNLGWTIDADGELFAIRHYGFDPLWRAIECHKNNNWFATKKEAEKQRDKNQAIARVKEYIAENFGVFEPDWGDFNQDKYVVCYDHKDKELLVYNQRTCADDSSIGYLKSRVEGEQLAEDCKEDLEIIYK